MKASFCTLVLGNTQEAMAHAIPQLSSVGYDGLEFWDQYLSTADLGWLKETTDEFGMRIVQICPYFDFTSDGKAYEKSILDARRYVEYARALDAPYIRTYTGTVGSDDATPGARLGVPWGIRQNGGHRDISPTYLTTAL